MFLYLVHLVFTNYFIIISSSKNICITLFLSNILEVIMQTLVSTASTYSFQFFSFSVLYALHYLRLLTMWQLSIYVGCIVGIERFGGVSHAYVIPDDGIKVSGVTVLLCSEILPYTTMLL
jgi:hypothetical protein